MLLNISVVSVVDTRDEDTWSVSTFNSLIGLGC